MTDAAIGQKISTLLDQQALLPNSMRNSDSPNRSNKLSTLPRPAEMTAATEPRLAMPSEVLEPILQCESVAGEIQRDFLGAHERLEQATTQLHDVSDAPAALDRRGAASSVALSAMRDEIESARAANQRAQARFLAFESIVEHQADLIARQERQSRSAAEEIVALRTSTSWKVTRPMRLVSRCLAAVRKGPAYWKHLYTVRAQVIENWRRANPTAVWAQTRAVHAKTQAFAITPPVPKASDGAPPLSAVLPSETLSVRALEALRRAKLQSGQR